MTSDTPTELRRRLRELDEEIAALRRERQRLADALYEHEHGAASDVVDPAKHEPLAKTVMAAFVTSTLPPTKQPGGKTGKTRR